jgi:hypothetical protein
MAREQGTGGLVVVAPIDVSSLVGDRYVKDCVVKARSYAPVRGLRSQGAGA